MRHINIKKIIKGGLFSGFLLLGLSACEDYDFPVDKSYDKTFRPPSFKAEAIRATSVRLEWDPIYDAAQYVLELSQDSLVFDNPVQYELPLAQDSITLRDLYSATRYSARIRALGREGKPDSEFNVLTFATLGEQIFTEVVPGFDDESNSNYLDLSWLEGSMVTHIEVLAVDAEPVVYALDEAAIESASFRLEDLAAATEYTIGIYRDANRRGWYEYSSFPAYPDGARFVEDGEDLAALLTGATEEQLVLVLEAGAVFDIGELQLSSAIDRLEILANPTQAKPVLQTTRIQNNNASAWVFRNLEITGNVGKFFMDERNTTPLAEVLMDGCYIHSYRGVLRLDGNDNHTQINSITINNSVLENIADYGVVNGGRNGGYRIEALVLSNSTINGVQSRVFDIRRDGGLYRIENCTFYNAVGNNREVLFTENGSAALEVKNTIFGKMFDQGEDVVVRSTNQSLAGDFVFNSYALSDFVISENHPFAGIALYPKASVDVFADPENGDFSIIDNAFTGRVDAGDPRWRP